MMFNYDVMTEEAAMQKRYHLLPDGEYDAVIATSEDKVSANSGNPMMDMTLDVYDLQGVPHTVRDFLVFTENMMWKVIYCADSAGLLKEYEEKKFCSELVKGKTVRVKITTEVGGEIPQDKLKGKSPGSRYPDKNKVAYYIKKGDQKSSSPPLKTEDDPFADDSDIPF
jgi:hypothetical protein